MTNGFGMNYLKEMKQKETAWLVRKQREIMRV
jgi:hypothetical protein